MARIRTIKPEFFTHSGLGELSPYHRLLFAGLWTQADRAGRLKDDPKKLKVVLLPYDDVDVSNLLQELADHPEAFITRYEIKGEKYIQINGFSDHQLPNHKEPPSEIPSIKGTRSCQIPYPNDKVRREVYARDNYICHYCGIDLKNDPHKICLDHVIPLSQGGSNDKKNLATSCKKCNARKTNKNPEQAGIKWPEGLGMVDPPSTPRRRVADKERKGREGKGKERKGKEGDIELDILPDWISQEAWDGYLEMRKAKKKLPTERALKLIINKLREWREKGHDPTAILNASTVNGWTDIYEPKTQGASNASKHTGLAEKDYTKGLDEF